MFPESLRLTNVLWALASLGHHPGAELLDQIAARATLFLPLSTTPQQVANLTWAYAKLAHDPGPAFLLAAEAATVRQLAWLSPQELANVLWGFATLGRSHPQALLEALQV
jgi:hypothetical protein